MRAAILLTLASAAIALLPFRKAIRLGCVTSKSSSSNVEDCVWAVEAAAALLPWRTKCIEQGIAVQHLLRSAGINALLHFGARHCAGGQALEAHVWVKVEGRTVIGGDETDGFGLLATYP